MECWESDAIQDSISILSTLNPTQSSLGKIVLEVPSADGSKRTVGPVMGWIGGGLDTILSKLADASVNTRRKRLTLTLVVVEQWGHGKLAPAVKKWLPKLLPRFNKLGLLHVHHMRDSHCRTIDDGCLCHDKPDCLREDF